VIQQCDETVQAVAQLRQDGKVTAASAVAQADDSVALLKEPADRPQGVRVDFRVTRHIDKGYIGNSAVRFVQHIWFHDDSILLPRTAIREPLSG
jgi:hypothetical protein